MQVYEGRNSRPKKRRKQYQERAETHKIQVFKREVKSKIWKREMWMLPKCEWRVKTNIENTSGGVLVMDGTWQVILNKFNSLLIKDTKTTFVLSIKII